MARSPDDRRAGIDRILSQRAEVQERLDGLTASFADIVAASASSNADDEHDPEGSTIAFERSQVAALIAQARQQLDELDAARGRLEDDTYGTCAACGEPIDPARLEARPVARTCIACARRAGGGASRA